MKFKVSTNIKSILGKDLISDKYIAIFELVKNACDAGAEKIDIEFIAINNNVSKIIITDDGYGMTADDLQNKWLFMAYSEKRHGVMKNKYAGSKGIGRFSCDRLGKVLLLKTKKASQKKAEQLLINWQLFENDDTKKVEEIDLEHQEISAEIFQKGQGTILEISDLRETWERPDLLKLRAALMKLVSPDRVENQKQATISIIAKHEQAGDEVILKKDKSGATNTGYGNLIVNGPIENDVFERLGLKTTSVTVNISESGDEIETRIEDRGSFVFKILRRNTTYAKIRKNCIHFESQCKDDDKCCFTQAKVTTIENFSDFSLYQKSRILNCVLKAMVRSGKLNTKYKDFHKNFNEEIIIYRNALAHQKSTNKKLYIQAKDNFIDIDDIFYKQIRTSIIKYKELLDELFNNVVQIVA